MATGQGIRAGKAFVELFADDTRLVRGLKAAEQRLKAFGASVRALGGKVMAAGAAIVTPLLAAAHQFAGVGANLDDLSQRTGVSAEALSELGHAAEMSGASLESLAGALFRMRRRIANAASGGGPAVRALRELGDQAKAITQLPVEDQFMHIVAALEGVENESLRAQYAFEIFGDGAKALLPLLNEGAAGIEAFRAQARRLGITLNSEDAAAAAAFSDAWDILKKSLAGVTAQLGAALIPLLTDVFTAITEVVTTVIAWVRQNQQLVIAVFKLAIAAIGAGAAFVVLGTMISGIGAVLGAFAGIVTGVGTVLAMLGKMVVLLLSPIVIVSAAVAALGAYLVYATGVGAKALSWLAERFVGLKDDALAAWQGIGDALASGDIGLAAKILWLTLKLQWQKGVAAINEVWATVKEFFLATWTEAVYGSARIATNAWAGLQTAWVHTVDFLRDAWSVFTTWLVQAWHTSIGFIKKAWIKLKSLFDDEVDAEAEITRINQEVAAKNQAAEDARNRQIFEREQARRQRLGQIEGERTGALDQLAQMRQEEHAARQRQNQADQTASEQALEQARKEWQDAIAEAARKRKETEAAPEPERMKKAQLHLSQMSELMTDLGDAKVSVKGTFSAFGARGIGAEGPAERTARSAEEIAKNTRGLLRQAQHGGIVFG